ncbi:MAG: hypothetical protein JNM86_10745 [Phycisphaerae bacterium]|nr:hypothetical protein [Phycisphaerae bacterium]
MQSSSPPLQDPGTPDGTITVDFAGGTLEQYVEALRTAAGMTPMNVVVSPEVADVRIPRVKLTKALPGSAIISVQQIGTNKSGKPITLNVNPIDSGGPAPAYSISLYEDREKLARLNNVLVLSLNPIVGLPGSPQAAASKLDAKTVLSAIEVAVLVSDDEATPQPLLKFHEASGLLFVRGSQTQRAAATEVVQQLRKDIESERAADQAATAGRDTKKMLIKSQPAEDVAEAVRRQLIGKCCVQLEVDGKYIVITGDKALVAEAAQRAYAIDGMPRPSTPAPNSDAK